jgi:hypothetical protein
MWVAGVSLAAIVVASSAWALRGQVAYARIATAYAAKQTCSCIWVSGRTLESCVADLPEDAREALTVRQEGFDGRVVRASVLFGAISAEAVAEGEFGCRID